MQAIAQNTDTTTGNIAIENADNNHLENRIQNFSLKNNYNLNVIVPAGWNSTIEPEGSIVFIPDQHPENIALIIVNEPIEVQDEGHMMACFEAIRTELVNTSTAPIEESFRNLQGYEAYVVKSFQDDVRTVTMIFNIDQTLFTITASYDKPELMSISEELITNIVNSFIAAKQ
jgi:hypothetical protein